MLQIIQKPIIDLMNCYRTKLKFSFIITIYNIYKYFSQVLQIAQKPIIDFLYTFIGKNALATNMLESLWWNDLQKLTFLISSFQCRKSVDPVLPEKFIPDICHFFTRAKFLENRIYTEKMRKLRQNTQ